jgi:hypothetical protein
MFKLIFKNSSIIFKATCVFLFGLYCLHLGSFEAVMFLESDSPTHPIKDFISAPSHKHHPVSDHWLFFFKHGVCKENVKESDGTDAVYISPCIPVFKTAWHPSPVANLISCGPQPTVKRLCLLQVFRI